MKKIIDLQEEVRIGNFILEKGDKIYILEDRELALFFKEPADIKINISYRSQSKIDPERVSLLSITYNGVKKTELFYLEDPSNSHGFLAKKLFYNYFNSFDKVVNKSEVEEYLQVLSRAGFNIERMENKVIISQTNVNERIISKINF